MRSILLVGGIGADKTMFRQHLQGLPIEYIKTQTIETFAFVIDTSGEYLGVERYKYALMLASHDVDVMVLMQSATSDETRLPLGLATTFNREALGVVTYVGVATEVQVHDVVDHLARAGAHRIVAADSVTSKGFKRVQEVLCRASS